MIAQVVVPRSRVRDYVALTKPRIIVLLLFTALGGMFLAAEGAPGITLTLLVLGAGALAAGGANALNQSLESDIDERMSRTRDRPVVTGSIPPGHALTFGIALNVIAFAVLSMWVNSISATLTLSATLFYVFIYTKLLKRTTPQNIVIGGAAGAIPPMVGWTAVTGYIDLPAIYLFAIIFFWTPPHFWALSLILKDDYAKAGVPMLPVVVGIDETKKAIFLYTWLVLALTLMFSATGPVGWIFVATCVILGVGFIFFAWRLMQQPGTRGARGLFFYSMVYLALLFLAIMVDSLALI